MGGATSTTGTYLLRCPDLSYGTLNESKVSGPILSNVLSSQLKSRFSDSLIVKLISSTFALKDLHLTDKERDIITQTYMKGPYAVFVSFSVLIAIHLCSCVCIRDYGLKQGKAQQQQKNIEEEERVQSSEGTKII